MMQKTDGSLTIIVPCYNGEGYIQRCTESLADLRDDICVLFVNDGSTDSSAQIIEEWIKTRPNASLVTKPNGGYATAINCGLQHCCSEYVMFLGVDDEIVAEGIHEVVVHLQTNSPDILAFTTVKMFDDVEGKQAKVKDPYTVYHTSGYFKTDLFSLYNEHPEIARILFTRDTSRCYKMSCIGDIRYFGRFGVSADGCFSTLVACRARSFEFINVDGYLWHLHRDSVSARKKTKKDLMDQVAVWDAFFSHFQSNYSNVEIPAPIVSYACVYRMVVCDLSKIDKEYARKHKKRTRDIFFWLLQRPIPFTCRLKLLFPALHRFLRRLRKRIRRKRYKK